MCILYFILIIDFVCILYFILITFFGKILLIKSKPNNNSTFILFFKKLFSLHPTKDTRHETDRENDAVDELGDGDAINRWMT